MFSVLSFFFMTSVSLFAQEEYGLASYYGDEFHGRETAYGETYDKTKFTCAHKKHPKGTMLKVTRIDNNKSVIVRVNDKGPFVKGRIIDLSKAAAQKIGLLDTGLAEVKIQVLGKKAAYTESESKTTTSKPKKEPNPKAKIVEEKAKAPVEYADDPHAKERARELAKAKERAAKEKAAKKKAAAEKKKKSKDDVLAQLPEGKRAAAKKPVTVAPNPITGVYKIVKDAPAGYTVQVASTNSPKLMEAEVAKLKAKWFKTFVLSVEEKEGKAKFNVGIGSFENVKAANNYKKNLKKKYKVDGFVTPASEGDVTPKGAEKKAPLTRLNLAHVESGKFGVQVASLKDFKRYMKEYGKLANKGFDNILLGVKSDGTYKVILGAFDSKEQAKTYQKNLVKKYKIKGFVINLDDVK